MTTERRAYTETLPALDGDCDFRRRLKPSAMMRYVERKDGVPAENAVESFLDEQYPDAFVEFVWPNMKITK